MRLVLPSRHYCKIYCDDLWKSLVNMKKTVLQHLHHDTLVSVNSFSFTCIFYRNENIHRLLLPYFIVAHESLQRSLCDHRKHRFLITICFPNSELQTFPGQANQCFKQTSDREKATVNSFYFHT